MKKIVNFDPRAKKELKKLSKAVRAKITVYIDLLERDGVLVEPHGKKIDEQLFEIRIKVRDQWRLLYAYIFENYVIILTIFQKKTQKTPLQEIEKAKKRLKEYQS
jgi:phage-related protein